MIGLHCWYECKAQTILRFENEKKKERKIRSCSVKHYTIDCHSRVQTLYCIKKSSSVRLLQMKHFLGMNSTAISNSSREVVKSQITGFTEYRTCLDTTGLVLLKMSSAHVVEGA